MNSTKIQFVIDASTKQSLDRLISNWPSSIKPTQSEVIREAIREFIKNKTPSILWGGDLKVEEDCEL